MSKGSKVGLILCARRLFAAMYGPKFVYHDKISGIFVMLDPGSICAGGRAGQRAARTGLLASGGGRQAGPLALGVGLACLVVTAGLAAAQPSPPATPPAPPRPATAPRPPAAGPATSPLSAAVMKLTASRGEVLRRRAAGPEELLAAPLPLPLARNDEVIVRTGAAELSLDSGMQILVPEGSAVSVLGVSSIGLLRGEIQIVPKPGKEPRPLYVQGPPGSFPLKVRDALVRLDGDALVIMVYDGVARPGSPTISWGPAVNTGQGARWAKGAPPPTAKSLLAAPAWPTTTELLLQGQAPLELNTRWQPVPGAQRYRLELLRSDGDNPPVVSMTSEVTTPRLSRELRGVEVGSYLLRVSAIDDLGAIGVPSVPRRLFIAQVPNLEADGVVRMEAGGAPQLKAPPGQPAIVLVDGEVPPAAGVAPGTHRLRVVVGGLSAEVPLVATAKAALSPGGTSEAAPPPEPRVQVAEAPPLPRPPSLPVPPLTPPPVRPAPPPPPLPSRQPSGPEDVLLGGVGEVPFDGIRSPWAGRLATIRLESTLSGAARLAVSGRLVFNNGFGLDISASLLRTALASVPADTVGTSYGNLGAAVRSPALRKGRFALQALVAAVAPLSGSVLDASAEVDPSVGTDGTNFRTAVRPSGGGWRVEPAALLGVRIGRFALITTQGASLRITPQLAPSYAGGLLIHAEVLPLVRFVTFAQWQVGYLGVALDPGDSTPDVGGAAGAGFEILLPAGRLGHVRLELLGRAGIGNGGAAVYGRGTFGLQVGYRFR